MPAPSRLAGILAIAAGLILAAHGAWIPAKAWLAQQLITRAWEGREISVNPGGRAARDGRDDRDGLAGREAGDGREGPPGQAGQRPRVRSASIARPWPWADTVPVARLRFERLGRDTFVLAGDSGAVLAFGPGHRTGTALPGTRGNAVISGHRDTHFSLLSALERGDRITVETPLSPSAPAAWSGYRVVEAAVIHVDDPVAVATVLDDSGADRLTLVTCWPFGAIDPGTPWRYVVTAVREEAIVDQRSQPGPTLALTSA